MAVFNRLLFDINARVPRVRHFRYRGDQLQIYSESEIKSRFKLSKRNIEILVDLLREDLQRPTNRNNALSVTAQVLAALRFYSSGSHMEVIADTMGIHKSSVSRAVNSVSEALCRRRNQFIQWPTSEEDIRRNREGFYNLGGFPLVLGCIDGTHIRIKAPHENEHNFVNRKGFHSINVQAVCNYEGIFTDIVARWPGSTHDSHMFNSSRLATFFEGRNTGIESGILLGDSGYACRPFLMTPYLNPNTDAEEDYNRAHVRTRNIIERTFGRWKRKFGALHSEIRLTPSRCCKLIMACAVLHNFANKHGEPFEDDDDEVEDDVQPQCVGIQDGCGVREYITRSFFA